jgi:Protein of unknown function DUF262
MTIGSPQPSVLHLVTLFRQITAGDIRIPAFQREFVWKEKQIVELLESVLQGFPIGSILLWNVDSKVLKIAPAEATSFPVVDEHFPTSYVLDGMQRLSTLYGVFHFGTTTKDARFDVLFDLENDRFVHRAEADPEKEQAVPLSALFTPRQLLEHQARLSKLAAGDDLIAKLLTLQAAFQDYMVPVVTIRSTDVHRIVGIFEKVNSTGTKLDPVDFMRAITWAEDFDLNHYLDDTTDDLTDIGFALSAETIIKCVGLTLHVGPTTDGLLQLRNRRSNELRSAFNSTKSYMRKVSRFLEEKFEIRSSDYVPYEGQLLLLFRSIGMGEATPKQHDAIVRWFWATGFNESLRGKPDHYVVRAIENWQALVQGRIRGLEPRLKISSIDFFDRRLVKGGALSATFTAMHAAQKARNLSDGQIIEPSTYMASADANSFEPVFSRSELVDGGLSDVVSARILGNLVLVDRTKQRESSAIKQSIVQAVERGDRLALDSQFINRAAMAALASDNPIDFIEARSEVMFAKAEELVSEPTPPGQP